MALTDPVLAGPSSGRTVTYGSGSTAELKIAGEQTGGAWAVIDWHVRAGDEPPMHKHTREDETVYVVEGSITAYVGDQTIEVEAGSYAALPNNVAHGLTVCAVSDLAAKGSAPSPWPRTCIEFLPNSKLKIIVIEEI